MFIHPWDGKVDEFEWQEWLATVERFGILAVNNLDSREAPITIPTHFTISGNEILFHLARPNPVWPHLESSDQVRLTVVGDYAFIPGYWRASDSVPMEHGVPTSYYASVQFVCRPEIEDAAQTKVEILNAQLRDLQPEGMHAEVDTELSPYGPMLTGIRGIRLHVIRIEAKFKFDDQKSIEHRVRVSNELSERGVGLDTSVAGQQRRRLSRIGDWKLFNSMSK